MNTVFKTAAVAMVALGVSGAVNPSSMAFATGAEVRAELRTNISNLIIEAELAADAIDEQLQNGELSREEERALLRERRMLLTEANRLKVRRRSIDRWGAGQLRYWSRIYTPDVVSPA